MASLEGSRRFFRGPLPRLLRAALCLIALSAPVLAQNVAPLRVTPPDDVADGLIVRFRSDKGKGHRLVAPGTARLAALGALAGTPLSHRRAMSGEAHVLKLSSRKRARDVEAIAALLRADPDVLSAEPDYRMYPLAVPNETYYGTYQWHYKEASVSQGGVNLPLAWDVTTGNASIVVAVLDTGILSGHADMAGRLVSGYDFVTNVASANDGGGRDGDPADPGDWTVADECWPGSLADDSSWHGTHVAGTVGAASNNSQWGAGVNWNSKILPVRVLGKCGGALSDIVDAMRWSAGIAVAGVPANANPAKVLNMSLGGQFACAGSSYESAIADVTGAGAAIVVAAANENLNVSGFSPASCAGVITVAAVGFSGEKASYSNFGTGVSLAAPGGNGAANPNGYVWSAWNTGTTSPAADTLGGMQGTSQATPHVAGIASLLLSIDPSLTPAQVKSALTTTARAFPTGTGSDCTTSLCCAGIVDALAAVQSLRPTITSALSASGQVGQAFSYTITAANSPTSFNAVGLPAGLSVNTANGLISGTPTTAATTNVTISAANAAGTGSATLVLTVSPPSLANPPTASAASGIAADAVTANWGANGNLAGTEYYAECASDSGFATVVANSGWITATSRSFTGLTANTAYYFRVKARNSVLVETLATGLPSAVTLAAAPASAAASGVAAGGATANWGANGNPSGTRYYAECASDSGFATVVANSGWITAASRAFTGLTANTAYYFRVKARNSALVETLATGLPSVVTLAAAPASAAASGVTADAVTANWGANGNPSGTRYYAECAADSGFATVVSNSGWITAASHAFTGLTSNTAYYFRVKARNASLIETSPTSLPSATPVGAPTSAAASGVTPTAVTANWGTNGNASTLYYAECASDAGFTAILSNSGWTTAVSFAFTGLTPSSRYYFRVKGRLNGADLAAPTDLPSVWTLAAAPVSAAPSAVAVTSMTANWGAGGNSTGTEYYVEGARDSGFSTGLVSSGWTAALSAAMTGLTPGVPYAFRGKARNGASVETGAISLPAATTLEYPPTAVAVLSVTFTSVTVRWTPPVPAPSSYRLDASPDPGFGGSTLLTAAAGSDASSLGIDGLDPASTYYLRVASLNPAGTPNYAAVGTTVTWNAAYVKKVISGSSPVDVSLAPLAPSPIVSISVHVPQNGFPSGTSLSVNTGVSFSLPAPVSNEAVLTPLGPDVGMEIAAGGLQPNSPVRVTIAYDPALFPPGQDERRLQLLRYDPAASQWTLVPSQADARSHVLTALTSHFSLFAPFFVTPGDDLGNVRVFPQPWEIGDAGSRFWAGVLTLSGLPIDARVRILTVTGELVADGRASYAGVYTWDGANRFGKRVASGTYYAAFESNGQTLVRRVVIIR
ncbi:MAG: hypothetical protein A2V88_16035 [Elusimicrobia bacterium RBG_16_66_12]|nr:MAG: hypothetical protein A2V88_16035 [Elusimicrobia bacterium RBG_16_66_12]